MRTAIVCVAALLAVVLGSAQTKLTTPGAAAGQVWREYVYPTDRFTITLPEAPNPHDDSQFPNTTTYSAAGVTLRVTNALAGCDFAISDQVKAIEEIKSGKRKLSPSESQFQLNVASVKKGTLEGYPYLEFEQTVRSNIMSYERWYCGGKKLYVFSAIWQTGQSKPANVERIVQSFRLIKQQ